MKLLRTAHSFLAHLLSNYDEAIIARMLRSRALFIRSKDKSSSNCSCHLMQFAYTHLRSRSKDKVKVSDDVVASYSTFIRDKFKDNCKKDGLKAFLPFPRRCILKSFPIFSKLFHI